MWTKILDAGPAEMKALVPKALGYWKSDADLAGIRDEKELAKLSEGERETVRQLWKDVESLQKKAASGK